MVCVHMCMCVHVLLQQASYVRTHKDLYVYVSSKFEAQHSGGRDTVQFPLVHVCANSWCMSPVDFSDDSVVTPINHLLLTF